MLLRQKMSDKELVTELYLWSVARQPSDAEMSVSLKFFSNPDVRREEAAQDLMWALLNSRDFLLNH